MLIKKLEVKGFKSLKDVVWEPGPLTILIGPNGSGKSNIIRSIEMLSSSAKGELEDAIQNLGGVLSTYWDGSERDIHIKSTVNIGKYDYQETPEYVQYTINTQRPVFSPASYIIDNEYLVFFRDHTETQVILVSRDDIRAIVTANNKEETHEIKRGSYSSKETIVSRYKDRFETNYKISCLQYLLEHTAIYQHINTSIKDKIRLPILTRYEKYVDPDGQNLVNVLHTLYSENRDFENDINTAMRAAFGDDFDRLVFPPAADQLVQLRIRWKTLKREQSMLDLSDGTIRFLFLMTVLCNPEPTPLIAIDEPETGLHPSMFPIIAEYAAEASKRTQVIFSTHSPQFLDAFSDFDVTTTVTSWQDGETKIKNLDGDTLKDWLKHYSLGTLFTSGDLEALA
ncbi:MAG: AAA family ATPase [Solidesulfovibrio sp.]